MDSEEMMTKEQIYTIGMQVHITGCAQCKKEFQPKTPQHRFCSMDCSKRFYRQLRMLKRDERWQKINGLNLRE
jgi:hypothetical protein